MAGEHLFGVPVAGFSWKGSARRWFAAMFFFLLLLWQALKALSNRRRRMRRSPSVPDPDARPSRALDGTSSSGISKIISEEDLKNLITNLEGNLNDGERWEDFVQKKSDQVTYTAKCCRSKEGSLKSVSTTIFENCSAETLRDFYMDNDYRKKWDRTLVDHQQLEVDEASGTEAGRTIKKFPLLSLREYVLAWRLWQGEDSTFYCVIKECEHPSAPRQKKYVRVGFFRSGWRIRKVSGRDACEITMVHQEDAGLNPEVARLAFTKGVWSYVGKMNKALRDYTDRVGPPLFIRPLLMPPDLIEGRGGGYASSEVYLTEESEKKLWRKPSKTWIAKGLLLAGGIACLSRGHSSVGVQIAVACLLKKLVKQNGEVDGPTAHFSRGRRGHRHRS